MPKREKSTRSKKVAQLLVKNPNASISEVARRAGVSKSLVSRIAKELEEKGVIQRKADEAEEEVRGRAPKKREEMGKRDIEKDLNYISAPTAGSPLRDTIVTNAAWWQEATQELGKRTAMLALQLASSDNDIEKTLSGFKSAGEFVDWATDVFHAFVDLKRDATALLEERQKRRDAEARVALRDIWIDALKQKLGETQAWFAYALKFVPREEMMKMTLVSTAYSAVNNPILAPFAQAAPTAQGPNAGVGTSTGAGAANGQQPPSETANK
ncbi:MarR family transcriptional regulator [Tardisphaera saccharovorans]